MRGEELEGGFRDPREDAQGQDVLLVRVGRDGVDGANSDMSTPCCRGRGTLPFD